jgi:hypothetical protein
LTTQASHSRAHGTHPCRALVATYLRLPTAFAFRMVRSRQRFAPEERRVARKCPVRMRGKTGHVTSGLPAGVTKISQNKRVCVGVDPACDRDQVGDRYEDDRTGAFSHRVGGPGSGRAENLIKTRQPVARTEVPRNGRQGAVRRRGAKPHRPDAGAALQRLHDRHAELISRRGRAAAGIIWNSRTGEARRPYRLPLRLFACRRRNTQSRGRASYEALSVRARMPCGVGGLGRDSGATQDPPRCRPSPHSV